MSFWQDDDHGVERELRARRAHLDRALEDELASRVTPVRRGRRSAFRAVVALGATTAVFAALAASGGVSYAVTAATDAVSSTSTTTSSSQTQYGEGSCVEYVNPHGAVIPPAGQTSPGTNPNSGQNPDGFYQISSSNGGDVYVIDTGTGTKFGPYPSGTVIKYTEANGATPTVMTIGSTNGQAGAVTVHILGQGDPAVEPVGSTTMTICYVPPPPK